MTSLGFVGLGAMGSAMARNLFEHGTFREVHLYNRTGAKTQELKQLLDQLASREPRVSRRVRIFAHETLDELIGACQVVVFMLHGDGATQELMFRALDNWDDYGRTKMVHALMKQEQEQDEDYAISLNRAASSSIASERNYTGSQQENDGSDKVAEHQVENLCSADYSRSPGDDDVALAADHAHNANKSSSSTSASPGVGAAAVAEQEGRKRLVSMLLINCATVSPETVARITSRTAKAKDAQFVNCSVTGRPEHAAKRLLCSWISSEEPDAAAYVREKVAPCFSRLSRVVSDLDATASAKYKICTNFLVYGLGELLGECLCLLDAAGIERDRLLDFTQGGVLPGAITDVYAGKLVKREFRTPPIGADLSVALKDLRLMRTLQMADTERNLANGKPELPLLDLMLRNMIEQEKSVVKQAAIDGKSAGSGFSAESQNKNTAEPEVIPSIEWCSVLETIEQRVIRAPPEDPY
ncbi:unnamed protein product [Amoebophrya sp. A120]|nr:unnamed protein product [Amoebophrya sp. A120]|eukprot:GSA120T00015226001.1